MEGCSFIEARNTGVRAVYWDEGGILSWTAVTDWAERDRLGRARQTGMSGQTGTKAAKLAVFQ
jgi:hypothetical protein